MIQANVLLDNGADIPIQNVGITQHDMTQLAKMISDLQSFTSRVQVEGAHNKKLFAEINSAVDVSDTAFMQACASLGINPRWIEQKYTDQFTERSLFARASSHVALAGNGESCDARTNLIKGLFGLAVSYGLFGQVALLELQRSSWEHGLSDVHKATTKVCNVRDSLTHTLLEEASVVIATAGDSWNANIRNKLRDIAWVAMKAEITGVNDEGAIARIKKVADTLLRGVGIPPLHAV